MASTWLDPVGGKADPECGIVNCPPGRLAAARVAARRCLRVNRARLPWYAVRVSSPQAPAAAAPGLSRVIADTDPRGLPQGDGPLARWAAGLIRDPRDLPFLALMAQATLVLLPFAAALYVSFRWWLAPIYLAVNFFVFLDRFILMLHNTSHRELFKPRYRLLNRYIPWVLGPFFGESPDTYYSHHLGMHHPENNLEEDLSSTMPFRRDRIDHFLVYFFRFFFIGLVECSIYLWTHGRRLLCRRMLVGEITFLAALGLLLHWSFRPTLVVFVIPFVAVRFLMMAGNWGQHAFIDAARPENSYANSITCINSRYNRRCFNDGYHIGHHLKANRHWSEMPGEFHDNLETYAREGAIVFEKIDFFMVWLFLMLRQYKLLARHYVNLDGQARSQDEIVALLRGRTGRVVRTQGAVQAAA